MAKEDLPICSTYENKRSDIKHHIISDCLKFNQNRIDHKIPHNLDATLGPNYQQNIDLIKFLKQTNKYNQI